MHHRLTRKTHNDLIFCAAVRTNRLPLCCPFFFLPCCEAFLHTSTFTPLGCCSVRCVCTLWDLHPTVCVCGCLCNWCDASQRQLSDSAEYLRRRFQQGVCSLPVCDTLSRLNTHLQVQGPRCCTIKYLLQIFRASLFLLIAPPLPRPPACSLHSLGRGAVIPPCSLGGSKGRSVGLSWS